MVDLKVTTITGVDGVVEEEALEEFSASVGGQVVLPGGDTYV